MKSSTGLLPLSNATPENISTTASAGTAGSASRADHVHIIDNTASRLIVPIGSIIAWAKSLTGVPSLPDNFVECNGQVLNDTESPLHGQTMPLLNGSASPVDSGTADEGNEGYLGDSSKNWTTNAFKYYKLKIVSGLLNGKTFTIESNTRNTITIMGRATEPFSGSQYEIYKPQRFLRGAPTSGNIGGADEYSINIGVYKTDASGTNPGYNATGVYTPPELIKLPSYYEVVWIIKVK